MWKNKIYTKLQEGDPHPDVTSPANSGQLVIVPPKNIKWPQHDVFPSGLTVTQHPTHMDSINVEQVTGGSKARALSQWTKDMMRAVTDQGGSLKINPQGTAKVYGPSGSFTFHPYEHKGRNNQFVHRQQIKDLERIGLGDHWLIDRWRAKRPGTKPKEVTQEEVSSMRDHFVDNHDVTHEDIAEFSDEDLGNLHDSYPECGFKVNAGWKSISSFQKHAPYGIPKSKGGDNARNVAKMERCVEKLMAEGHDKSSAIAICKNNLGFTNKKSSWKSVASTPSLPEGWSFSVGYGDAVPGGYNSRVHVMDNSGETRGYIDGQTMTGEPIGTIGMISVDPEHQGKGLATALFNELASRHPRVTKWNSGLMTEEGQKWWDGLQHPRKSASIIAHDDDDDWEDWDDWDDEDWEDWGDPTTPTIPQTPTVVEPSGYNEKDDPVIAFINASTLLSDQEVELIQKACQKQVDEDFGPSWHLGMRSIFVKKGEAAPHEAWSLFFLDKPTISGALGYHDFINGEPVAYVFISTSQQANVSPSSVASHEVLEMLADPLINTTAQVGNQTFYALESCDAVQQSSYTVNVELNGVSYPIEMSNFVTPDWFRTETNGPWDFLRKLSGPLELLPKGSYIGMWTPKTGWVQKNAYGEVEPLEEDDKRYVGDETATTIYHAPQEPQRCLRPFQRRQMDKPLQVTSTWKMIVSMARDEELLSQAEFYHFPNPRAEDYMITAQHSSGKALGYILVDTSNSTVKNIKVSDDFKRRGVATALWNEAKRVHPDLRHSMDISPSGREWAKTLDPESAAHVERLESGEKSLDEQLEEVQRNRKVNASWRSVAMPADQDFLKDIEWDLQSSDWGHRLNAFHPEYPTRIGAIEWAQDDGEITGIETHPHVRRRGLATLLYQQALSLDSRVHHSRDLTPSGLEFVKSLTDENSKKFLDTPQKIWEMGHSSDEEISTFLEDMKRPVKSSWRMVTAMPKNRAFLDDVRFEHKVKGSDHTLEAYHPEGGQERVAVLTWDHDNKLVDFVYTNPRYRRQGLATMLWDAAERVTPGLQHQGPETLTNSGSAWAESTTTPQTKPVTAWKSVVSVDQPSLFDEPEENPKKEDEVEDPYKLSNFFDFRVYPTKKDLLPNECDNDMMTCEHGSKIAPGHKMLLAIGKEDTYFEGKKYRFHHGGECQKNGADKLRRAIYSVYGPDPE